MEKDRYEELKIAERGAIVSIVAYIFLAIFKIAIGTLANSSSLAADGLNNFTDIIGSCAVLIGLRLARRPADSDHVYGHWKIENIASMITSFIMLLVGLSVLNEAITKLIHGTYERPDILAASVGIISAIVMFGVYLYNTRLAKKVNSQALAAAAKDNLSDLASSIGTTVAILATSFHLYFVDSLAAAIIGALILKTAYDIFKDSAFSLSDGFDDDLIEEYEKVLLTIKEIKKIRSMRGRTYGANIFLDVVVEMDPSLTVLQSHYVTEIIEKRLKSEFGVFDVDVHVEPYDAYSDFK